MSRLLVVKEGSVAGPAGAPARVATQLLDHAAFRGQDLRLYGAERINSGWDFGDLKSTGRSLHICFPSVENAIRREGGGIALSARTEVGWHNLDCPGERRRARKRVRCEVVVQRERHQPAVGYSASATLVQFLSTIQHVDHGAKVSRSKAGVNQPNRAIEA